MWFWVTAQARAGASPQAIAAKRRQWVAHGKDRRLRALCRTAHRYVVAGHSPPQVFWLLETGDPGAVQLIAEHFSDLWTLDVRVVVPQPLTEAVGGRARKRT